MMLWNISLEQFLSRSLLWHLRNVQAFPRPCNPPPTPANKQIFPLYPPPHTQFMWYNLIKSDNAWCYMYCIIYIFISIILCKYWNFICIQYIVCEKACKMTDRYNVYQINYDHFIFNQCRACSLYILHEIKWWANKWTKHCVPWL